MVLRGPVAAAFIVGPMDAWVVVRVVHAPPLRLLLLARTTAAARRALVLVGLATLVSAFRPTRWLSNPPQ